MAGSTCPKCGHAAAEGDVFCSACDCVLDVAQVLEEAEASGEFDKNSLDDDGGEEVLFDPDAASDDDAVAAGQTVPAPLDADLAAELQSVLDDGTGTVEVPTRPPADELDAADLFDQPDASAEGEPVAPPPLEGTNPFGGSALIVGDAGGAGSFESMLSDNTGAFPLTGVEVEQPPPRGPPSAQDLTAPTAVLSVHSPVPLAALQLSPMERHLVKLIDGKRTVLRLAKKAGVNLSDATTALRMLADRKLLRLVGHARLKGAPPPSLQEPMELPLDALTPLELPADALTPLDAPPPGPSPFDGDSAVRRSAPFDGDSGIRRAADAGGVRPAPSLRPAAAAGGPRKALVVKDLPAPSVPAGPHRPAASTMTTVKAGVDPAVQARARQLIEVALKELRQNRKPTALSWVKMASDLLPGDARIQALLANWSEPADKLIETATAPASAAAAPPGDDLLAQARALEDAGDAPGAANAYRRALKLNPGDAELYNRLGIVLALRLKDFIGASAALKKALELVPSNLAYRSNLGKVVKMAGGEKLADPAFLGGDEAHKVRPEAADKPASFLDRLKGLRKR